MKCLRRLGTYLAICAIGVVPAALAGTTPTALAAPAGPPASHVEVQHAGPTLTAPPVPPLFSGEGPAAYTFSLEAGIYVVGVTAIYNAQNDPEGAGECSFYGHIDGVQNSTHVELSDLGPVVGMVDYFYNPVVTFAAGEYTLDVVWPTNCNWSVQIRYGQPVTTSTTSSSAARSIGIVSVGAYIIRGGKFTPVTVVPMGQPVYFFVFYKVVGILPTTLTGHVTVQQRSGPPTTFSLKAVKGVDRAYFAGVFSRKTALLGHATATFALAAGPLRATRLLNFTLANTLNAASG
jgi:hypothetical protein